MHPLLSYMFSFFFRHFSYMGSYYQPMFTSNFVHVDHKNNYIKGSGDYARTIRLISLQHYPVCFLRFKNQTSTDSLYQLSIYFMQISFYCPRFTGQPQFSQKYTLERSYPSATPIHMTLFFLLKPNEVVVNFSFKGQVKRLNFFY